MFIKMININILILAYYDVEFIIIKRNIIYIDIY